MDPIVRSSPVPKDFCNPNTDCDPAEVVANILNKYHPRLIAFGEIHMPCGSNKLPGARSTMEIFAESIMPELAKHHINDLVIEFIVSDQFIETELNYFYSPNGSLDEQNTPYLFALSNICIFQGIRELLTKSKALGIRVHGGGPTYAEINNPEIQHEVMRYELGLSSLTPKLDRLITKKLEEKIRQVMALPGKNVASYGGALHNDIDPGQNPQVTFGWKFQRNLGSRYVEVDLALRNNLTSALKDSSHPDLQLFKRHSEPFRNTCWQRASFLAHFVISLKDVIDPAQLLAEVPKTIFITPGPVRTTLIRNRPDQWPQ
ncbi:MAG: hypothetical protein WC632_02470 [Candidatus Margulisiibacteriota bacterium]